MLEFTYQEPTLKQIVDNIARLSKKYNADIYFCGKGNGSVKLQCESRDTYRIITKEEIEQWNYKK